MLDIQFIRENQKLVEEKAKEKGAKVDVAGILELHKKLTDKKTQLDEVRQKRNLLTEHSKGTKPSVSDIEQGRKLREQASKLDSEYAEYAKSFAEQIDKVPNIFPDDTPIGGEANNLSVKKHGAATKKDVADHLSWGEKRGYIDFERGSKVAGNKFYYTLGPLVDLEYALIQFALSLCAKHGFTPMTVPHMVNEATANGTGFSPKGEEDQIYTIAGEDLSLIATSEISITGYHATEIIAADKLPLLYAGVSPAYRKEAGAYGKHSRGLYRVHQFNKVEMYVLCDPKESEKWHQKLLDVEEELCQALEIPYQLVRIASGDLGAPAYKKFDIEYWSPADGSYHELMSCSNVTDYQARRLKIRYKTADNKIDFVHTLNGTAMAFSRTAIAIIENNQTKDGDVIVPKVLRQFMGGKESI